MTPASTSPLRPLRLGLTAACLALLAACGGSGGTDTVDPPVEPPAADQLRTAQRIAGYPHDIDLYIPAGATRAIVFLHGGTGRNFSIAYQLGINTNGTAASPLAPTASTVDWAWLRANKVIAVFPQGQVAPRTADATTWSNWAMNSGQDDVAFLRALASYLRSSFAITKLGLSGHSMGGTMTNRMWCESPTTFDAYVAIAGPASAHFLDAATPCRPTTVQPYMSIIGSDDNVMRDQDWTAQRWTILPLLSESPGFINPDVWGEWDHLAERVQQRCGGAAPALDAKTTTDSTEIWSACSGSIVQWRILGADHGINGMESIRKKRMVDAVASFVGF